ncbi:HNH endonuclease signature motif containing protein [Nocardioides sp. SYSU D00038]|uniref:HNH endonuclease signature motif containing protein n=1 Tax=Nocardioides sp. SYSU D00038 TaxID=2812554 RepID=UPI00196702F6|nr:HNH endonuclease signature motif containing protein [Nocardioides sp. SYSU D00038]
MTGTRAELLAAVRDTKYVRDRAEADLLRLACEWADLHPAESIVPAMERWEDADVLGGEGTPQVAEFCVAELGLALGTSTHAARLLLAEALELRHRLKRLWARVQAGEVQAWKARTVAKHTIALPPAVAAHVDSQLETKAARLGPRQVENLVTEAILRFDPDRAERDRRAALAKRYVRITHGRHGIAWVDAQVDTATALQLETAIAAGAKTIETDEPLDLRRANALGQLVKGDTTVVVHFHDQAVGLLDNTREPVTLDQVADWCGKATVVKPVQVIDLNTHHQIDSAEVPARLKRQAELIFHTCAFPHCTRPAARCDTDHTVAYDDGGPTCSCNLVPLCRRHHRLKTHAMWTYDRIDQQTVEWTSPHGLTARRDPTGTWEP